MPKSYPDFPRHDHIAKYFDDYVDHFGFRDRIRFGRRRRSRRARCDDGALPGPDDRRRDDELRRRRRRQRPPLGPALARAAVPGQRHLRGRADALPLLRGGDPDRRQGRRRPRHGQLGDGHRRRRLLPREQHLSGRPPRRLHRPQVPVRQADRPDRRRRVDARLGSATASCPRLLQAERRQDGELRAAGAGPQVRARPPDGQRPHPRPARARRDHDEAEHRVARGRQGPLHRRQSRSTPTSSSTARATRSRSRSSTRTSSRARDNELPLYQYMFHPEHENLFFLGLRPAARSDHADRRAPVGAGRRGAARAPTAPARGPRWTPTSPTSGAR